MDYKVHLQREILLSEHMRDHHEFMRQRANHGMMNSTDPVELRDYYNRARYHAIRRNYYIAKAVRLREELFGNA